MNKTFIAFYIFAGISYTSLVHMLHVQTNNYHTPIEYFLVFILWPFMGVAGTAVNLFGT